MAVPPFANRGLVRCSIFESVWRQGMFTGVSAVWVKAGAFATYHPIKCKYQPTPASSAECRFQFPNYELLGSHKITSTSVEISRRVSVDNRPMTAQHSALVLVEEGEHEL
jgi:hypothetical protein